MFNLELGVAVVKAFAKVRLDERVLRVLTGVDFKDDLDALAARGARYGFPGWPVGETTAGGKAKTTYLERYQAHGKAREYLEGAKAPGEIAGRCLALIVMAALADETCVAQSNRSFVSLHDYTAASYEIPGATPSGLPWRRQVLELVEDLALERLPEHLTATIRERRTEPRTPQQTATDTPRPATRPPPTTRPPSTPTSPARPARSPDRRSHPAGGTSRPPDLTQPERRLPCPHERVGASPTNNASSNAPVNAS